MHIKRTNKNGVGAVLNDEVKVAFAFIFSTLSQLFPKLFVYSGEMIIV